MTMMACWWLDVVVAGCGWLVVPNETTACVPLLPSALQRHSKVAAMMMMMMTTRSIARNVAAAAL